MTTTDTAAWDLYDLTPESEDIAEEVMAGLSSRPRVLPCKLLYDARGSELFEAICEQPEYYPTRTELAIMLEHAADIAHAGSARPRACSSYGSGASTSRHRSCSSAREPVCYVPVDISSALTRGVRADRGALPRPAPAAGLWRTTPKPFRPARRPQHVRVDGGVLPRLDHRQLPPDEAAAFLRQIADHVGPGGALLIGVDREKPSTACCAPTTTAAGVTAAFNLNILRHINRQTGSDFDPEAFRHEARWNPDHGRVEMHLVADREQTVRVRGETFEFAEGDTIWTESSYKHTPEGFAALAEPRFDVAEVWCDDDGLFSVQCLDVRDDA